jgi:hypothetical protein
MTNLLLTSMSCCPALAALLASCCCIVGIIASRHRLIEDLPAEQTLFIDKGRPRGSPGRAEMKGRQGYGSEQHKVQRLHEVLRRCVCCLVPKYDAPIPHHKGSKD